MRGIINRNNSITSSLTQQIGQNFQKLLDKRIEASEFYWNEILRIKSSIPASVRLAYTSLSEKRLTKEYPDGSRNGLGVRIGELSYTDFQHYIPVENAGDRFVTPDTKVFIQP